MKGQVLAITEFDSNDEPVNPDRHDLNLVYTTGLLTSMWFTDYKNTWTKTFSYSGSDVTKITRWIKT